MLNIVKVVAGGLFVIFTTLVGERVSPKWAGIIMGFPCIIAFSLFFIGYEGGVDFAVTTALWSLLGLSYLFFYLLSYFLLAKKVTFKNRFVEALVINSFALAIYLTIVFLILRLVLRLEFILVPLAVFAACMITLYWIFNEIQDRHITKKVTSIKHLLFRGLASGLVIMCVTIIAKTLGPSFGGAFSAFPVTTSMTLLIMHKNYGKDVARTILKHSPKGLVASAIFAVTVYYIYPFVGIYLGTVMAFLASLVYLIIYMKCHRR